MIIVYKQDYNYMVEECHMGNNHLVFEKHCFPYVGYLLSGMEDGNIISSWLTFAFTSLNIRDGILKLLKQPYTCS